MNDRFTTKEEIMSEIDKCKREYDRLMKEADRIEQMKVWGAADEAKKIRLRASGLLTVRAQKLKEKLAEFQTEVFVFMDGDHSIPARLTEKSDRERMPQKGTYV